MRFRRRCLRRSRSCCDTFPSCAVCGPKVRGPRPRRSRAWCVEALIFRAAASRAGQAAAAFRDRRARHETRRAPSRLRLACLRRAGVESTRSIPEPAAASEPWRALRRRRRRQCSRRPFWREVRTAAPVPRTRALPSAIAPARRHLRESVRARKRIAFARRIGGNLRSRRRRGEGGDEASCPLAAAAASAAGFCAAGNGSGGERTRCRSHLLFGFARCLSFQGGRCCRRCGGQRGRSRRRWCGRCRGWRRSGGRIASVVWIAAAVDSRYVFADAGIVAARGLLFFRGWCRGGAFRRRFRRRRRHIGHDRRVRRRRAELVRWRELEHADGDRGNRGGRGKRPPASPVRSRFARIDGFGPARHLASRRRENRGIDGCGGSSFDDARHAAAMRGSTSVDLSSCFGVVIRRSSSSRRSFATA